MMSYIYLAEFRLNISNYVRYNVCYYVDKY